METPDEARFTVTDRDEILRVLNALVSPAVSLSAFFNEGDDLLLSALLAVQVDEDALLIDTNANPENNQRFLDSQRAMFVANSDGATVKWTGTKIERAEFEGRPAFRIALPKSIRRIQRRGAYRVATPVGTPVICTIRLSARESMDLPLADICADGIGVELPHSLQDAIKPGQRFDDGMIVLPDTGVAHVSLIVQSIWEHDAGAGHKRTHAGLAFVGLRPATQSMVQRYVNKLDRMRIAALPGH